MEKTNPAWLTPTNPAWLTRTLSATREDGTSSSWPAHDEDGTDDPAHGGQMREESGSDLKNEFNIVKFVPCLFYWSIISITF